MSEKTMQWKRTSINLNQTFQTREAEDGNRYIEGYFAVFDGFYNMWYGDQEQIDRHAFDGTVNDDIRALINHDTTLVLGRTTAGTLKLQVDDHGLYGSVLVNWEDQDARNIYARVQRGDVNQCSIGFDIIEEEMINRQDGTILWVLKKVKLYEVSCCTFPAYEDTAISARAADREELQKRELAARKEKARKKLQSKGT